MIRAADIPHDPATKQILLAVSRTWITLLGHAGLAGNISIGGASPLFLSDTISEIGFWPIAFNSTQLASMNANQHAYWGFLIW